MEAKIKPTEKIDALVKHLEPRVDSINKNAGKIHVEASELGFLEKVPGIKEFELNGEYNKGLGGSPVEEKAYIKIHSKKDVVEAFLATASGYDLLVTECSRDWDLKLLRRYNPSIKEVSEPSEVLQVDKSVNIEGFEELDFDLGDKDIDAVYRKVVG